MLLKVLITGVAPYHELDIPQISDIKFHQPSNQVLITSRSPGQDVVMWTFSPKVAETEDTTNTRPRWLLGQGGSYPLFSSFFPVLPLVPTK